MLLDCNLGFSVYGVLPESHGLCTWLEHDDKWWLIYSHGGFSSVHTVNLSRRSLGTGQSGQVSSSGHTFTILLHWGQRLSEYGPYGLSGRGWQGPLEKKIICDPSLVKYQPRRGMGQSDRYKNSWVT